MSSQRRYQGHVARKRFGQNFLVDQQIIARIIQHIAPKPEQKIIEIGPGLGALTEQLLEVKGTQLDVLELDRDLVARLQQRFGTRLLIHQGDALAFDFSSLADTIQRPSLRLVGNLPYNISSPLLFHLLKDWENVIDQHFMLQAEVVERMIAVPGTKAFGRLSVMLQAFYTLQKLLDVPPDAFCPVPKVNSAVVRMVPVAYRPAVDEAILSEVVTLAFSQRRKMLRHTLGKYQKWVDFSQMNFDLSRRAEAVSVEEYIALAQVLENAR